MSEAQVRTRVRRRQRSDGERTRAAILEAAVRLASVEGVHGMTIGRLAEALGMSKSGLYAHFGSKQQLQLETIEAAQAVWEAEVVRPAERTEAGLARLEALVTSYYAYLERWVFPGGCFFAGLLAEADARPGAVREVVAVWERGWLEALAAQARAAQARGEFGQDLDPAQLAFELHATFGLANYHFVLFRDAAVLERGRRAAAGTLRRAVGG